MQLIRWRKQNGLSVRRVAELCGDVSAASINKMERGQLWPSPDVIERIHCLTRAIGPESVGAQDHFDAWRKNNAPLLASIRAVATKSARAHRRLAGKPRHPTKRINNEPADPPIVAVRVNGGPNG